LCKEEVESLYQIFEDMLKKMDKCLLRMEQHLSANVSGEIDIACPEWSRYLTILKELRVRMIKIYVYRFLCFSVPRNRFETKIHLVTQFDFSISEIDFYSRNREIEEIRRWNF